MICVHAIALKLWLFTSPDHPMARSPDSSVSVVKSASREDRWIGIGEEYLV